MQCEKAAFEKYGGMEGIEQHRRDLQEVRQERRALKRVTDRDKVRQWFLPLQSRSKYHQPDLSAGMLLITLTHVKFSGNILRAVI